MIVVLLLGVLIGGLMLGGVAVYLCRQGQEIGENLACKLDFNAAIFGTSSQADDIAFVDERSFTNITALDEEELRRFRRDVDYALVPADDSSDLSMDEFYDLIVDTYVEEDSSDEMVITTTAPIVEILSDDFDVEGSGDEGSSDIQQPPVTSLATATTTVTTTATTTVTTTTSKTTTTPFLATTAKTTAMSTRDTFAVDFEVVADDTVATAAAAAAAATGVEGSGSGDSGEIDIDLVDDFASNSAAKNHGIITYISVSLATVIGYYFALALLKAAQLAWDKHRRCFFIPAASSFDSSFDDMCSSSGDEIVSLHHRRRRGYFQSPILEDDEEEEQEDLIYDYEPMVARNVKNANPTERYKYYSNLV
ncbi:Oidioi.mRNA.OKI2018_I69.chr1.g1341.t1.cds [Oikopleura dioica]|uniref:Oidioi.mRNA.OKI2018_I69.chr1.g1341.t1.cds n=1 Tax=Oikopleura dioica TaxID=34765 RepID=A0ABN7SSU6_OIKDI|nr:Oidioi.mRNA.OKI2018_I69.chr1.g1341.t1.cds [Oikopleura dioica]